MVAVPNIKLNSGFDMPQVGFGLWKVDNSIASDAVYNAIKAGYRLFDGACDYGNEVEVGKGVARAIKDGLVKREELFLVSKLWNTFHDGDRVEPIARKQLADLGIDYFDLYVIHFPVALEWVDPEVRYPPGWHVDGKSEIRYSKATIHETWAAMESLVEKGLARSIGISNFQGQLIYDLLRSAKIRPATLQIEHHPYLTQVELIKLAKAEGIAVTAYSSFGSTSFDEFDWAHAKAITPLLKHELITEIAQKLGKTNSQVLLRWSTQRGLAVIPKTNNASRLAENLDVTSFDISDEDMERINALNTHTRFNKPNNYFPTELLYIFG
ncbi:NAD(P)H-dependent D-xylose reductase [Plectosphaerella cucumerina]|uniref:NAD(P)H-dependent D-xylose reductase n=1 Tax=Plectosphaerella cucumerina TaxID=40658 RepID=A0A8K0TMU9_9PEZI|nr:NAD(P)H-dependent D-xylose reductase [Plectosphaerella cucumerina]